MSHTTPSVKHIESEKLVSFGINKVVLEHTDTQMDKLGNRRTNDLYLVNSTKERKEDSHEGYAPEEFQDIVEFVSSEGEGKEHSRISKQRDEIAGVFLAKVEIRRPNERNKIPKDVNHYNPILARRFAVGVPVFAFKDVKNNGAKEKEVLGVDKATNAVDDCGG